MNEKRDRTIQVRVTQKELIELKRRAWASRRTLSDSIRETLFPIEDEPKLVPGTRANIDW